MRAVPFDVVVDPGGTMCVRGDCDMDDAPKLVEAAASLPERVDPVIDLAGVTYMGSAALAALITIHRERPGLRLRRVPPKVQKLMEVAGLDGLFDVVDDPS